MLRRGVEDLEKGGKMCSEVTPATCNRACRIGADGVSDLRGDRVG